MAGEVLIILVRKHDVYLSSIVIVLLSSDSHWLFPSLQPQGTFLFFV